VGFHGRTRRDFGVPEDWSDGEFEESWRSRTKAICKPCWEVKYCPYGPLVEDYPLLPPTRAEQDEYIERLRGILDTGKLLSGAPLDDERAEMFRDWVDGHDPDDYPVEVPEFLKPSACKLFGHVCPVFFEFEWMNETGEVRRTGRSIPFETKARVARRDNSTCQLCGEHLLDSEIEFDHLIPVSRGGSSEENNLRVTCQPCNRRKSAHIEFPGFAAYVGEEE